MIHGTAPSGSLGQPVGLWVGMVRLTVVVVVVYYHQEALGRPTSPARGQ